MRGEKLDARGQTTLFFALGLVLLIVIGIAFLFLGHSTTTQAPESASLANNRVLNEYVASCIDTVMDSALDDAGKSGGYSLMGSTFPHATVKRGTDQVDVIYGITNNSRVLGGIIPFVTPSLTNGPINYPGITYPGAAFGNMYLFTYAGQAYPLPSFSHGYFGEVHLPAVCSKTGPNGPGSTAPCRYYIDTPPGTGNDAPGSGNLSLQDALIARLTKGLQQCADLRQFSDAVGQDVTNASIPNATVKFTQTNVLVTVVYNLTLQGAAQSTTVPFERRYDVRLLPLAEYAYDLALQESRNLTFDIALPADYKDTKVFPAYDGNFTVTKTVLTPTSNPSVLNEFPASLYNKADLITITDQQSTLEGQPYSYSFLIEHRMPLLDWTGNCGTSIGYSPDSGIITIPPTTDTSGFCVTTDSDGRKDKAK